MTDRGVELDCADSRVSAASIRHTRAGAIFGCTISAVPDEMLESLRAAVDANETIRLIFPKAPLILERVEVERVEPGCVRIVGRIVAP
jgi:hypothetical protein